MDLTIDDLKAHLNITGSDDDAILTRLLAAAIAWCNKYTGDDIGYLSRYAKNADLQLAILMLAADWYENREASVVGVSAMTIPFGVREILNEVRRYTFAVDDCF